MKTVAICLAALLASSQLFAQERLPIIDMHLHALAADAQGPPPLAVCTPFDPMPGWDPARPFGAVFMGDRQAATVR